MNDHGLVVNSNMLPHGARCAARAREHHAGHAEQEADQGQRDTDPAELLDPRRRPAAPARRPAVGTCRGSTRRQRSTGAASDGTDARPARDPRPISSARRALRAAAHSAACANIART